VKAIVCSRYGLPEVLRREERATPVPRKNAVRIRILATAVTSVARGVGNEGEIAPVIDRADPRCDRLQA
jgi:hypothetical protein